VFLGLITKILAMMMKSTHCVKMQQSPRFLAKIARRIPAPYLETAALLLLAVAASYFA